jgi:long-subunit fatty acid transport protein
MVGVNMKKTVIVLLALFVPASLWAMDINQGRFELSGQSNLNFSKMEIEVDGSPDTDVTSTEFQFDGLYYLQKNLGLGLSILYDKTEIEVGAADIDTSTLLIGPQVSYNIPLNEKISLFVNGLVGYATEEIENEDADGWGFQVGVGLKYFLTNSASINGTLSYQSLSLEDDPGNDFDSSGVGVGIGLSMYF